MKFSLMWANTDYNNIFPFTAGSESELMFPGRISPQTWDKMTDYIIEKYFKHPSYWLIDGVPYFSVYDLTKLLAIFGTVEGTVKGLEEFRRKTKVAGFNDLHLNAIVRGRPIILPNGEKNEEAGLIEKLGFNSTTSYVWMHHLRMRSFPVISYDSVKNEYYKYAEEAAEQFSIPYFPNVTMGWDPSPRTNQNRDYGNTGYPYTPIIIGNSPDKFRQALIEAKEFMDKHLKKHRILTINAWNEWTEGSYLEPDTINKMKYLKAVNEVFGNR